MSLANHSGRALTRRSFTAAAAATVAFPYVANAQAAKPIKMGAPMPLTGRYSREALYCVDGYRLWAKHINEMGYSYGNEYLPDRQPGLVKGRKVDMTILDDTSDPTTGARLMTYLVYNTKVDLL